MNKVDMIKILKIAFGCTAAILIADLLNLQFSASAGIITLLSLADTKKSTLYIARDRVAAFLLSIVISFVLFQTMGYRTITFGIYLLLFVAICFSLRLENGISISAVLTTHFLSLESMNGQTIGNELLLFVIGVAVGILLNMYMPDKSQMIKQDMKIIESDIKEIFLEMAKMLNQKEFQMGTEVLVDCESHLKSASTRAYENMNNSLMQDTKYYMQYIDMRKNQLKKLKQIYYNLGYLTYTPDQGKTIIQFMKEIADSLHEHNNALELYQKLQTVREELRQEEMPKTRTEFENRAILYLVMQELEEFLLIKKQFVEELTECQIRVYWTQNNEG